MWASVSPCLATAEDVTVTAAFAPPYPVGQDLRPGAYTRPLLSSTYAVLVSEPLCA